MIIVQSTSVDPSLNLASEDYFFSQRNEDILFLYINNSSVIIGNNQLLELEVNSEYCERHSIPVYRRMSGGGTVFHDCGNLNYSFITNKSNGVSPLDGNFLKPIVHVLSELAIPVEIGTRKDLWLQNYHKISGTASHISRNRQLHHGTLLYSVNLEHLHNTTSVPQSLVVPKKHIASVRSKVMNIYQFLEAQNLNAPSSSVFFELFSTKLAIYLNAEFRNQLLSENFQSIKSLEAKYTPLI
jgi:lipoate-protein ligase A